MPSADSPPGGVSTGVSSQPEDRVAEELQLAVFERLAAAERRPSRPLLALRRARVRWRAWRVRRAARRRATLVPSPAERAAERGALARAVADGAPCETGSPPPPALAAPQAAHQPVSDPAPTAPMASAAVVRRRRIAPLATAARALGRTVAGGGRACTATLGVVLLGGRFVLANGRLLWTSLARLGAYLTATFAALVRIPARLWGAMGRGARRGGTAIRGRATRAAAGVRTTVGRGRITTRHAARRIAGSGRRVAAQSRTAGGRVVGTATAALRAGAVRTGTLGRRTSRALAKVAPLRGGALAFAIVTVAIVAAVAVARTGRSNEPRVALDLPAVRPLGAVIEALPLNLAAMRDEDHVSAPTGTAEATGRARAASRWSWSDTALSDESKLEMIEELASDSSAAATDALLAATESASVLVGMASVRALVGRPCERIAEALTTHLDGAEWQRRAWAARVLGSNRCQEAAGTLRARFAMERDERVRAQIRRALAALAGRTG